MKTVAALAVLSLLLAPSCRRPDPSAGPRLKADLAGAWVRDQRDAPGGVEGFDLRPGGGITLIGILSMNAIAWTASRNELVISTNTDRYAEPNPVRLEIASLENDVLTLRADPPDYLAGVWHRTDARRISGAVTYLEPTSLPPDARLDLRVLRAGELLARTLVSPKGPVPIAFEISFLPAPPERASDDSFEASIFTNDGPLFTTPRPIPVPGGASDIEVVVLSANR